MRHEITKTWQGKVRRKGSVVSNAYSNLTHLTVTLQLKHAEAKSLHKNIIDFLKRHNYSATLERMQ